MAEELLGSRKNLREFNYVEEKGVKCFICGERSGLVKSENEEKRLMCGVCAIKRNFTNYFDKNINICDLSDGPEQIYYPSVIEIAALDYKEKLVERLKKDGKLDELINAFKTDLQEEDYRISFWKERWQGKSEKEIELLTVSGDCFDLDGDKLKNAPNVKRLLKGYNKEYDLKLNKYYALICLDGDNMGQWIGGEYLDRDQEMTPELHALLSSSLTNYSIKFVKDIIERNGRKGKVVYAGGDDVKAFVNLEELLDVMRDLRGYFSGSITNGEVDLFHKHGVVNYKGEEILTLGYKAGISLGVCIAHYKEPLYLVIKKADQMEKMAKENIVNGKKKDAFAICLLKNSGEIKEATAKWLYGNYDLIRDGIKPLIEIVKKRKFSRSFIYDLKEELYLLEGVDADEIVDAEIKRLAKRKSEGMEKKEKEKLLSTLNILKLVYENRYFTEKNHQVNNLDNFISLLEIIFFIGKRGD